MGYNPWGRKESDVTERRHFTSLGQILTGAERQEVLAMVSMTASLPECRDG